MYCFITTVPVVFYWARSDDTVHYKSEEMRNFCGFRCATTSTSPITVFYELFFIYNTLLFVEIIITASIIVE